MGGTWAGEASGRSREGAPLANRNSLDGRDGNNRFVVAGGRFQPYSVMVACLAIPADDRCSKRRSGKPGRCGSISEAQTEGPLHGGPFTSCPPAPFQHHSPPLLPPFLGGPT